MEIVHESHDHPLLFTDGESEDNQDEPVVCWGCENLICGPRFSCFTCKFHLHKSCAELPLRLLGHPLHPQHPLSLLPRPSYLSKSYRCNACDEKGNRFVYHCPQCDFDLHITCALLDDQEGNIVSESTRVKDYFQYRLQQHLLVLEVEEPASLETDGVNCCECSESISAPFFFCSRLRCKFRIHKFCANLPKQIKVSFLHPERSLFLVSMRRRLCEICGQQGISFYVCLEPDLFFHPKCAFSNPRETMKRVGEKHIQHRSHHHNLTLLVDEKEWAWQSHCRLCWEELGSSPSYGCELCPFLLHKSCAELPGQIKSHLHPKHSLILFTTIKSRRQNYCAYCGIEVSKLNYRCLQCRFILHMNCFFFLHGSERRYDHHHSFVQIKVLRKLACDACGLEDYFSPWQCTACHLMVHKHCAELSRFLRVDGHNHVLKLTYYMSVVHECDKLICQLCYRVVNVDYAAYDCHLCNYVAHLSCAEKTGIIVSEEETQDDSNISFVESSLEGSHNSIANYGSITLLGDGSKGGEIQHFTHQHELTLNDQHSKDHIYCECCVTLISSPFYNCNDCGFYLHKQCAEMPKTKKFSFQHHLLHLNQVQEFQYCDKCRKNYNGFMYSCQMQGCIYRIDFHCVKLMEGLEHPCHEHRLFFPNPRIRSDERCQGCGFKSNFILVCSECEYVLGYCCAKLPRWVKHRYDDHLLSLAFEKKDEYGEYYCDICENERDLEDWFYCCIKCDFFAHIKCTLGSFPYIKFGTTHTFHIHDHPLTYVEQPTRKPPPLCCVCGKHCYSRVLECHQCEFFAHIDCVGLKKYVRKPNYAFITKHVGYCL